MRDLEAGNLPAGHEVPVGSEKLGGINRSRVRREIRDAGDPVCDDDVGAVPCIEGDEDVAEEVTIGVQKLSDDIAGIEFGPDERRRLDDDRMRMVVVVPIAAAARKEKDAQNHD